MLEVTEARDTVLRCTMRLESAAHTMAALAPGMVLAEHVRADRDSPPFTKSLRDGYAVRSADFTNGMAELRVIEEIAAGAVPLKRVNAGEASLLYTGAPIPQGADAVVMLEQAETLPDQRVRLTEPEISPGLWILPQAAEMKAGHFVLTPGRIIDPAVYGILATVGHNFVEAYPKPKVGILATGNELVAAGAKPGPGQIRNSNSWMLYAQAMSAGADTRPYGIARDEPDKLRAGITAVLDASDVVLLSGGVSAGKFDLVPEILAEMGVNIRFHQVRMKPGKPLLFGTRKKKLIFGLPGNPVSAFVGFAVFVKPALRKLMGRPDLPVTNTRLLTAPLRTSNDRPTFHSAILTVEGVRPVAWSGSSDLRALVGVNALIALPEGTIDAASGEPVDVIEV